MHLLILYNSRHGCSSKSSPFLQISEHMSQFPVFSSTNLVILLHYWYLFKVWATVYLFTYFLIIASFHCTRSFIIIFQNMTQQFWEVISLLFPSFYAVSLNEYILDSSNFHYLTIVILSHTNNLQFSVWMDCHSEYGTLLLNIIYLYHSTHYLYPLSKISAKCLLLAVVAISINYSN